METGSPSLKRKLDDSDEYDSDAEEKPRPMKRNKTPPADEPQADEDVCTSLHPPHSLIKIKLYQEWEIVVAPPSYEQVFGLRQSEEPAQDSGTPPQESSHSIKQDDTPTREVGMTSISQNSCLIATRPVNFTAASRAFLAAIREMRRSRTLLHSTASSEPIPERARDSTSTASNTT